MCRYVGGVRVASKPPWRVFGTKSAYYATMLLSCQNAQDLHGESLHSEERVRDIVCVCMCVCVCVWPSEIAVIAYEDGCMVLLAANVNLSSLPFLCVHLLENGRL